MRLTPPDAGCRVFTYKEGLLSAVAHDLAIDVARFSVEIDPVARTVAAELDATSLRVASALVDGKATDSLSAHDRATIERAIADEVLETRRFPIIRFAGRADERAIDGTLDLHGVRRTLRVPFVTDGNFWVATATLHQPDFKIRPYRAFLGTLRVRAEVKVVVRIPVVE